MITPAGKLAQQGDHAGVELLRIFGANPDYIALGYASAGNVEKANALLNQGGIKIKYLAIGAAMCANNDYAEFLREKFQMSPEYFIIGAVLGGNDRYASALYDSFMNVEEDDDLDEVLAERIVLSRFQAYMLSNHAVAMQLYAKENNPGLQKQMALLITATADNLSFENRLIKSTRLAAGKLSPLASNHRLRLRDLVSHPDIKEILQWMDKGNHLYNDALLTYELTYIDNPVFLDELTKCAVEMTAQGQGFLPKELGENFNSSFSNFCYTRFERIRKTAGSLQRLIQQYNFNYEQAEIFLHQKDVRNLLSAAAFRTGQMNVICLLIHKMTGISKPSAEDMVNKYLLITARKLFSNILGKFYSDNYSRFNVLSNSDLKLDRILSLQEAALNARSIKELVDISLTTYGLFNGTVKLTAHPQLPKHEQPLTNSGINASLKNLADNLLTSRWLNPDYLPTKTSGNNDDIQSNATIYRRT
jgi:hypothetical protein